MHQTRKVFNYWLEPHATATDGGRISSGPACYGEEGGRPVNLSFQSFSALMLFLSFFFFSLLSLLNFNSSLLFFFSSSFLKAYLHPQKVTITKNGLLNV